MLPVIIVQRQGLPDCCVLVGGCDAAASQSCTESILEQCRAISRLLLVKRPRERVMMATMLLCVYVFEEGGPFSKQSRVIYSCE